MVIGACCQCEDACKLTLARKFLVQSVTVREALHIRMRSQQYEVTDNTVQNKLCICSLQVHKRGLMNTHALSAYNLQVSHTCSNPSATEAISQVCKFPTALHRLLP
jgi:hypothetical protein